jgi:putative lipoprotein
MKLLVSVLIIFLVGNLMAENPWLGKDKVAHFAASTFFTCWSYGLSRDFMESGKHSSYVFSVGFTAFLGCCKEFSDKNILKTKWSWHDIAYDVAGIAAGLILISTR